MKKVFELNNPNKYYIPFIIALIYLIVGGLGVLLLNQLLLFFVKTPERVAEFQSVKDWIYLLMTSTFVFFLIRRLYKYIYISQSQTKQYQRRFNAIFNSSEKTSFVIMKLIDSELFVSEVSPGSERIFGYKANEIIDKSIWIFHTNESKKRLEESFDLLKQGQTVNYETILLRKTGEVFQATLTVYPLLDNKGKYIGALSVTIDISDYKRTEEKLKETTTLLKATLDNIPDVIGVQDMTHSIVQYNKAGCDFFKNDFRDVLGKKCYELLGYNKPCEECVTFETYKTRKPAKHERFEEKFGIWLDIRSYPIFNEKGEIIKIIEHMRDISDRKKAEELLRVSSEVNKKLLDEIVEYDKIKTEFFSNISHELRTPLTVIYSALQLVDKYHKDGRIAAETESVAKYIITMKQNSYRLLRLINNLIDITRIDSGFYRMKLENHNIVNIVEEITMSVANYMENKFIKLEFDTDNEEKIMAVDADKIERIMLNLLSNAAKFTDINGRIWVNMIDKGESVVIIVKDCGVGIPDDKLDIIFERFRQVDSSLSRSHEGSGIGLSLVKSFIEMHGGSIKAESKLGEGSQFIIELPVIILPDSECGTAISKTKNNYVDMISIEFSDIYFGNIA